MTEFSKSDWDNLFIGDARHIVTSENPRLAREKPRANDAAVFTRCLGRLFASTRSLHGARTRAIYQAATGHRICTSSPCGCRFSAVTVP